MLATFGLASPVSAKTFGTNLVVLVGHVDTFNAEVGKIVPIADKLLYYSEHLPAILAEVDALGAAAQSEFASNPGDRQAAIFSYIASAAKDYSSHGQDTLGAVATGNQALFMAAVQRMSSSGTILDKALAEYHVPYQDLLVDDPFWKVTVAVGIVLAFLLVTHALMWLFGKRSTLMDRERRRSRARLTGRALLALLMNAAGPQLYRIPGAATSVGVRAGMAAVSVASLAFYLIGKTQQHMLVRNLKREGHVPDKAAPAAVKRPDWAPAENSVTQYIIPVGDIAPISRPNDGVLLLGDSAPAMRRHRRGTSNRASLPPQAGGAVRPYRRRGEHARSLRAVGRAQFRPRHGTHGASDAASAARRARPRTGAHRGAGGDATEHAASPAPGRFDAASAPAPDGGAADGRATDDRATDGARPTGPGRRVQPRLGGPDARCRRSGPGSPGGAASPASAAAATAAGTGRLRATQASKARRVSMVSASAGDLSGRYRRTRANRSATPPA